MWLIVIRLDETVLIHAVQVARAAMAVIVFVSIAVAISILVKTVIKAHLVLPSLHPVIELA